MPDFDFKNPTPRDRLIVSLDLPNADQARQTIETLGDVVSFYKLGYQLIYSGGFDLVRELIDSGKQVFVDLKLLDIDNTVMNGVDSLCRLGATFLTVHAYPNAMRAALNGRADRATRLLGVTVLTSMDDASLKEAGYGARVNELVIKRARQAYDIGMDGIVCSAAEASEIRSVCGPDLTLVTPGIRFADSEADDQRRVMTPTLAIENGSDFLVVGRPILNVKEPREAAERMINDIENAL